MAEGEKAELSLAEREERCAAQHYVMSWVTPLSTTLLFGPAPRTFQDMWYLVRERGVTRVVDLRPQERGAFSNKQRQQQHYADRVRTLAHPMDPSAWVARGRLKEDKQRDLARQYVKHAAGALQHARNHVCYVHSTRGNEDEAYIAFALRVLLAGGEPGARPSQWLRDNNYETVLDNTRDKLELLDLVWQEARATARAAAMFGSK